MIKSGVSEGTIFHSEAVSFVHVGKFHYFFTIHYYFLLPKNPHYRKTASEK